MPLRSTFLASNRPNIRSPLISSELAYATATAAARFGFDQEHATRASGHMVNIPFFAARQIMEGAEAAIRNLVQRFGHILI